MERPPTFVNTLKPNHVCKLHRALYGLMDLTKHQRRGSIDLALFFLLLDSFAAPWILRYLYSFHAILLLLYVDDIILTGDNSAHLQDLMPKLHAMKDLDYLHYFLGVEVHRFLGGL